MPKEKKSRLRERLESIARTRRKGVVALALSLLLAAAVCGCVLIPGAASSLPEDTLPHTPNFPPFSLMLWETFQGERDIHLAGEDGGEQTVTLSGVPALFSPDSDTAAIWRFAVLDLDQNGEEEAVLQVIDGAGDLGGFLILHREGLTLWGFPQDYRYFEALKTDGTFGFSDRAGTSWGVGSVCFFNHQGRQGCALQSFLAQSLDPATGAEVLSIEGQTVSKEAFDLALEEQAAKPDALWYDFTTEGLAEAFPDMEDPKPGKD